MKVKVSNPMVKFLNAHINGMKFVLEKYTVDNYRITVDYDLFRNETDYNTKTGLMSTIKVLYPNEYYAMPYYLTTRELNKLFLMSDHTAAGFIKEIRAAVEI